jgi:hypothetical protein
MPNASLSQKPTGNSSFHGSSRYIEHSSNPDVGRLQNFNEQGLNPGQCHPPSIFFKWKVLIVSKINKEQNNAERFSESKADRQFVFSWKFHSAAVTEFKFEASLL